MHTEEALAMRACIVLRSEEFGDRVFPLNGTPLTLGRWPDRDVQIPDPRVSGAHAEVYACPGGWWIRDLGSANGTRVNEQPIRECRLAPNDRISLADAAVLYFSDRSFSDAETSRVTRAEAIAAMAASAMAAEPDPGPEPLPARLSGVLASLEELLERAAADPSAAWLAPELAIVVEALERIIETRGGDGA